MLTNTQQQQFDQSWANPTRCVADAWFYATMSAQKETADLLKGKFDDIGNLVESLHRDGIISDVLERSGHCAEKVQEFISQTKLQDARIEQLRNLTNLRFMVEVSDDQSPARGSLLN